MKDCKISDDGKVTGTYEEVLAYEEGLKNPLSRMRFPYSVGKSRNFGRAIIGNKGSDDWITDQEAKVLIAFANLAPLIEKWVANNRWEMMYPTMPGNQNLWEAYKAAVALISESK